MRPGRTAKQARRASALMRLVAHRENILATAVKEPGTIKLMDLERINAEVQTLRRHLGEVS